MHQMTINKLPAFESVKKTIRNYKCKNVESCGNPTCTTEIVIPDKYKSRLKGDPFLFFNSGFGNEQRIIVYGTLNLFHYYVRVITCIAMERLV